uniref:Uncharacterized protein n=1 Tax=Tanacetum cinerariifolium TaxID=118510 RepID=A0A6L2MBZ5_TANCI|nr:hypothetical protein [Tanacetum cinerariifolium]
MPTDLPLAPELPTVSPFLCLDDYESEPTYELRERYVSLRLYVDVVSSHIRMIAWNSTLGLRPVMTPTCSAALRSAYRVALSLETSSSDTSFGSSSDSTSHTSESSFIASLQGTQILPNDHLHHSSEAVCSPSGPLTYNRPQCSDYTTPTSSSCAGPSWKRSWSLATSIPSTVHTAGALSSTRASLLPPHKRYIRTSAIHSDESGDEGSPKTHTESDMNLDIRAYIKVETATTDTTTAMTVDGLGIEPVLAGVKMGFELGLAVVESQSEPEEAEADDEADAENYDYYSLWYDSQDIKEIISQRVEEALAAQEANRNAGLIVEIQSHNGYDNDNKSRGNGNHGNNSGDGN